VSDITLTGKVDSVTGSCPALTFTLQGHTVYTTADTQFMKGPCKDIQKNAEVEVRGKLMSDDRVRADRVTFEK
jgi:hypothetical protein